MKYRHMELFAWVLHLAAKDFEKRLPFKCAGYDSGLAYCCSTANSIYNPAELQCGWKNGDISLDGGWFTLLYDGEEQSETYKNMMIIGYIDKAGLLKVKNMPKQVNLTVTLI